MNWSYKTCPDAVYTRICYAPEIDTWVALATGGGSNALISRSIDGGETWAEATSYPTDHYWYDICWDGAQFLIVSSGGEWKRLTSSDGDTWTMSDIFDVPLITQGYCEMSRIKFIPELNTYVVLRNYGGGLFWTSGGGVSFTEHEFLGGYPVDFCYSPELNLFCGVGIGGHIWTMDPATWVWVEQLDHTGSVDGFSCIVWSPDRHLFVAGEHDFQISSNGVNWTFAPEGYTSAYGALALEWSSSLGLFVAVGDILRTSPTGAVWTKQINPNPTHHSYGAVAASSGASGRVIVAGKSDSYHPNNILVGLPGASVFVINDQTLPGSCRGTSYDQTISANEGAPPYTYVITAGALPTSLSLDGSTGEITGTIDADEVAQNYTFTVTATDITPQTADKVFSIEVYQEPIWITNSLPDGNISTPYSQTVVATLGDTYALDSGVLPDGLTLSSSGLISGTPTTIGTFVFTLSATSVHGCIKVQDIDPSLGGAMFITIGEHPPILSGTFSNVCNNTTVYNHLTVTDGTAPFTFYIDSGSLPAGLSLGLTSGSVQGVTAEPGDFTFGIMVRDSLGLTNTQTFGFTVYDSPVIVNPSLPPGVTGRAYSYSFASSGGTQPKLWIFYDHSPTGAYNPLPTGLVFNSMYGTITGTPILSATDLNYFPINIGVQDAHGCSDTKQTYVTIAGPPTIDNTFTMPPACVSQFYSFYIVAYGGVPPYYYFVTSYNFPPQNLTLDPYTGQLSGIPLIAGTYPFTIKVVDNNNLYSTKDYSLVVRTAEQCGQQDEAQTVTITRERLASLESAPVVVQDPFHQKHLSEYLPVPFLLDE